MFTIKLRKVQNFILIDAQGLMPSINWAYEVKRMGLKEYDLGHRGVRENSSLPNTRDFQFKDI